jgi:RNA polymerase sigma-70 factor, ECF subfamily
VNLLADASDEALLAAFVNGEQAAFDQLVDRHARRVYAICLHYFRNHADAEDAAQDTFLALYRRAETFSGAAKFSTWIYRVAMNACHDITRKRSRRPQPSGRNPSHELGDATAEDLLTRRELGLELLDALKNLEPEYREPILLHDVAGLPYADIAARLGVPIGTVKSRIHRGHAKLADRLHHLRGEAVGKDAGDSTEPSGPASPPISQSCLPPLRRGPPG